MCTCFQHLELVRISISTSYHQLTSLDDFNWNPLVNQRATYLRIDFISLVFSVGIWQIYILNVQYSFSHCLHSYDLWNFYFLLSAFLRISKHWIKSLGQYPYVTSTWFSILGKLVSAVKGPQMICTRLLIRKTFLFLPRGKTYHRLLQSLLNLS